MRVIIAGSRGFLDQALMNKVVRQCIDKRLRAGEEIEIVSGTARGADQMGEAFAEAEGLTVTRFPADWDLLGRSAGYRRNEQMAEYADALIAFWDGSSRGTRHMINIAKDAGLAVRVFDFDGIVRYINEVIEQ